MSGNLHIWQSTLNSLKHLFRKRVRVIIGRTGGPLYPVAAILAYMVLCKPGEAHYSGLEMADR